MAGCPSAKCGPGACEFISVYVTDAACTDTQRCHFGVPGITPGAEEVDATGDNGYRYCRRDCIDLWQRDRVRCNKWARNLDAGFPAFNVVAAVAVGKSGNAGFCDCCSVGNAGIFYRGARPDRLLEVGANGI